MEAIAVIAASLALASGIVKATTVITELSVELRDVPSDITAIARELHAFRALLGPVSDSIARYKRNDDPGGGDHDKNAAGQEESFAALLQQIEETLGGALVVVNQVEGMLRRYKGGSAVWRKLRWAMYGSGQMGKLRMSLESYKVALGIGLHVMSISIIGDVKGDTEVLGDVAEVIKLLQTDEILSRLETRAKPSEARNKVETWLERMADYTSYAETAYQATTIDPDEQNREWDALNVPESVPEERSALDAGTTSLGRPTLGHQDHSRRGSLSPISSVGGGGASSQGFATSTDLAIFSAPPTMPPSSTSVPSVVLSPSPSLGPTRSHERTVEGSVANLKLEQGQKSGIDWSPLVPQFLTEDNFHTLKTSSRRDDGAISTAWAARSRLSSEDRQRVDNRLLHAVMGSDDRSSARRPLRCARLLNEGALLDPAFASTALIQTIEQRDSQTLAVLLKYGTDPEVQSTKGDTRQPLAVAASSDVACLVALILAGASIRSTAPKDVCDAFCQSGTQTLSVRLSCSPFLAAFAGIRPRGKRSTDIRQFWMAHFLLTNGADVNTRTCTSATELIVRHWPAQSQHRITKHLVRFDVDVGTTEASLQFRYAVEAGVTELVQLLLENGVSASLVSMKGSPLQDPAVLAAENRHWSCLDLIVEWTEDRSIHLLSLVHVYMLESSRLSPGTFGAAVQVLLRDAPDGPRWASQQCKFTNNTPVLAGSYGFQETLSALELAERCLNKNSRNREEVVSLLRGGQDVSGQSPA